MNLTHRLIDLYVAVMANPADILREPNDDPYAPWVIAIAKVKQWLLPWYWENQA